MNLYYRNVYPGRGNKLRYGRMFFFSRKLANQCAGGMRVGVQLISRVTPTNIVIVQYQPTK